MKLIVVGLKGHGATSFDLNDKRVKRIALALLLLVSMLLLTGGGVIGATLFSERSQLAVELSALRSEISSQQSTIDGVKHGADQHIDALALRLGQIEAESARLNALGERLTQVGRLDDGEFDFSTQPAMGGPETPAAIGNPAQRNLETDLDAVSAQLAAQREQLSVLETLLSKRDMDLSLVPAGRPVRKGWISSAYGMRTDPITGSPAYHPGVDFNGPVGTDVLAVADGMVSYSGWRSGYGNAVEIDHGNGYQTRYGHNSENLVKAGDLVKAGSVIAKMGSTGRSTGSHVHLEVSFEGRTINPLDYVRAQRSDPADRS
jgi:murein DD-endopeptidase MepM/ murein hydrolase activator NlpD